MTTQVRKNVMDMFINGARRGFTIATTNLLPNVVMAFVIIQALKITGLLDWVGHICEPVSCLSDPQGKSIPADAEGDPDEQHGGKPCEAGV